MAITPPAPAEGRIQALPGVVEFPSRAPGVPQLTDVIKAGAVGRRLPEVAMAQGRRPKPPAVTRTGLGAAVVLAVATNVRLTTRPLAVHTAPVGARFRQAHLPKRAVALLLEDLDVAPRRAAPIAALIIGDFKT